MHIGKHVRRPKFSKVLFQNKDASERKYEYFVHFEGQDRRLDQWISGDQLVELFLFYGAFTPPEKNIEKIVFGSYEIRCWYYSPYRLKSKAVDRLFVCENCLLYTEDRCRYACHLANDCKPSSPPGESIYEESDIKVYEVFGALEKVKFYAGFPDGKIELLSLNCFFYCQRLCLLAKLFIDHKTLCFDVENFIFYVLCEIDDDGTHIAAMFSKEMYSANNLACIMTLPCYQRKGYGNLLIQLSYEMSKRAKYPGTPERPFSDLGEISYKKYWLWVLLEFFDCTAMRKASFILIFCSPHTSSFLFHLSWRSRFPSNHLLRMMSALSSNFAVPLISRFGIT
ncbi:unnamed protein product [Angiostrongylus costaricensis]|uniref:Histone acetyltransferase n=1 Tax=Angiostrongylus costaricensis TaxID=334426 RepID=A0A3P7HCL3_ANGCS|nr:unnamed protein product [Angiostrongylus costaricensis]